MNRRVVYSWYTVLVLSLALAAAPSCKSGSGGSSGYPTSPGGGGGGPRELDSGDFGHGGTYQHTFAVAGTYAYHCIHHTPMRGTVQVSASATSMLVNVSISSSTMAFPAASVKPGGQVVWTNNSGDVHTVTSN